MTCQYCGSPLAPGVTECQVCGEPIPSYGNDSAVNGQAGFPQQNSATSYSGTVQVSYPSGAQQYNQQNAYASQYARQYGAHPSQSYSQTGSYGSQNGYPSQYNQSYSGQAAYGYASNGSYGGQTGYYSQYAQPYVGQLTQSYGQSNGYSYDQSYVVQSIPAYTQNAGYAGMSASAASQYAQFGQSAQMYPYQGYTAMDSYTSVMPQYAMPADNMYSTQNSAAPTDAPVEIAGKTFRSLIASPLFVVCLILTSVSMILGTYIAFSGNAFSEHYQGIIDYNAIYDQYMDGSEFLEGSEFIEDYEFPDGSNLIEDFELPDGSEFIGNAELPDGSERPDGFGSDDSLNSGEDLENLIEDKLGLGFLESIVGIIEDVSSFPLLAVPILFEFICTIGDRINVIPHLLILIGLWVAFGTISSRSGIPFSTGGLTCIKVGLVFRTVLSCIIGGFIILALLITTIAGTAVLSFFEELAVRGSSALLTILLAFVAYFVIRCIYYAKQTTTLNMVRTTAAQGVFNLRLSTYVIFWNFFLAVMHLAAAVLFNRTPILLVRHLANAAVLVMFSVSMILYRKKTFELRDSSIQVYM